MSLFTPTPRLPPRSQLGRVRAQRTERKRPEKEEDAKHGARGWVEKDAAEDEDLDCGAVRWRSGSGPGSVNQAGRRITRTLRFGLGPADEPGRAADSGSRSSERRSSGSISARPLALVHPPTHCA